MEYLKKGAAFHKKVEKIANIPSMSAEKTDQKYIRSC